MAEVDRSDASPEDLRRALVDVTFEAGTTLGVISSIANAALADLKPGSTGSDSDVLVKAFQTIRDKAEAAQNAVDCEAQRVGCYFDSEAELQADLARRRGDPVSPAPLSRSAELKGLAFDLSHKVGTMLDAARAIAGHQRSIAAIAAEARSDAALDARLTAFCPSWGGAAASVEGRDVLPALLQLASEALFELAAEAEAISVDMERADAEWSKA